MKTVENNVAGSGNARIAVIGVGGAGCKIASEFYGRTENVGVIGINTDRKSLKETPADTRLFICKEVTKGLGTNGDPALGKKCAQIHESEIMDAVAPYDYAYIIAGMGGGTGTGAASVVAELCDRMRIPVGAVAVMPFSFEGRAIKAAEGFRALHAVCSDVIRYENDRILSEKGIGSFDDAMVAMNRSVVNTVSKVIGDCRYKARCDDAKPGLGQKENFALIHATKNSVPGVQKTL